MVFGAVWIASLSRLSIAALYPCDQAKIVRAKEAATCPFSQSQHMVGYRQASAAPMPASAMSLILLPARMTVRTSLGAWVDVEMALYRHAGGISIMVKVTDGNHEVVCLSN